MDSLDHAIKNLSFFLSRLLLFICVSQGAYVSVCAAETLLKQRRGYSNEIDNVYTDLGAPVPEAHYFVGCFYAYE